mmetsp:Transcript_4529/g.14625  ORF Transcript_4529/g.14625 Transcript_4529/m.14625 type:complete len:218 (+) Transcript_4529:224-877(+)
MDLNALRCCTRAVRRSMLAAHAGERHAVAGAAVGLFGGLRAAAVVCVVPQCGRLRAAGQRVPHGGVFRRRGRPPEHPHPRGVPTARVGHTLAPPPAQDARPPRSHADPSRAPRWPLPGTSSAATTRLEGGRTRAAVASPASSSASAAACGGHHGWEPPLRPVQEPLLPQLVRARRQGVAGRDPRVPGPGRAVPDRVRLLLRELEALNRRGGDADELL